MQHPVQVSELQSTVVVGRTVLVCVVREVVVTVSDSVIVWLVEVAGS